MPWWYFSRFKYWICKFTSATTDRTTEWPLWCCCNITDYNFIRGGRWSFIVYSGWNWLRQARRESIRQSLSYCCQSSCYATIVHRNSNASSAMYIWLCPAATKLTIPTQNASAPSILYLRPNLTTFNALNLHFSLHFFTAMLTEMQNF